jgi:cytochrome c-type biogenesis protein CcmE
MLYSIQKRLAGSFITCLSLIYFTGLVFFAVEKEVCTFYRPSCLAVEKEVCTFQLTNVSKRKIKWFKIIQFSAA